MTVDATTTEMVTATDTAMASADNQTEFTPAQIAALKQLGVDDAPRGDLDVFFHTSKRLGLDPFTRQIYLIGRKTKVGGYRGEPERWETKYTIQTSIDGYRVTGHRIARREGLGRPVVRRQFCGRDGVWREVLVENGPPVAAKSEIYCEGQLVGEAVVKFAEFAQTKNDGQLTGMWRDKPTVMIGKCADAAAWRSAFPQDFSGVYEAAEFDRHEVIDGEVVEPPVRVRADRADRGIKGLRAVTVETQDATIEQPVNESAEPVQDSAPAEPTPEPTTKASDAPMVTKAQLTKLHILLGECEISTGDDGHAVGLAWLGAEVDRPLKSSKELTRQEASMVIQVLEHEKTQRAQKSENPTTTTEGK
ncbi:RecT-family phage protein [Mycobacteroides abscessus]|uniref:recombinase RecT n=1 Tax=Mycobacteroides abscessus TaxID=36809 RepID=UPI0005E97AC5|nr:recombinase RecT [Mycobacteroides abscessus]CPU33282.1 RecT-family phage protein [Mycobacteroides abscessus]